MKPRLRNLLLGYAYRAHARFLPKVKAGPCLTWLRRWLQGAHMPYVDLHGIRFEVDADDINGLREGSPGNAHIVKYLQSHSFVVGIDAGANIGYLTRIMALRCGLVYAFEPDAAMFELLKRNTEGTTVRAFKAAVGDHGGLCDFYLNPATAGDHSTIPGHGRSEAPVRVPMVRLDDVTQVHGSGVIVKVDVQGGEKRVLDGMPRLISEGATIIMEWWPEGLWLAGVDPDKWRAELAEQFNVKILGPHWSPDLLLTKRDS